MYSTRALDRVAPALPLQCAAIKRRLTQRSATGEALMSGITCAGCGAPISDATDDDPSTRQPCAACGSTTRNYRITAEPEKGTG